LRLRFDVRQNDYAHMVLAAGRADAKASQATLRENPLVSAIRTASLRNSSVLPVPMVHFICSALRY
jgi:hypothetical protein